MGQENCACGEQSRHPGKPEAVEEVRSFVSQHTAGILGSEPELFVVSAKLGQKALLQENIDHKTAMRAESGMDALETYITETLDDRARLGLKLNSPLGVAENVLRQAQELMAAVSALLNEENRRRFAATLANLEATSASMKPAIENMNAILVQVRKLLDDENIRSISRAAGEVGPLLADTRQLVGRMQATADKLDVAIGDASAGGRDPISRHDKRGLAMGNDVAESDGVDLRTSFWCL